MPYTIASLIADACVEINASSAGQPVEGAVGVLALGRVNMLFDHFNASERKLYADLFSEFPIPITGNPIAIGPGATWDYAIARPEEIPQASIILTNVSAPLPRLPLRRLTKQEWQALTVPTLQSSVPMAYYYNPTFPNGSFYFYTVEDTANAIQIVTRQQLAQVTMATTFAQPPGYWYALMMLLARKLSSPLRKPWKPEQERELTEACMAAFGNNGEDLRFITSDAGIPVSGAGSTRRGDFNWLNGQIT